MDPISTVSGVKVIIADNDVSSQVMRLEWTSFVNSGYTVKCSVLDPNHVTLKKIAQGNGGATLEYLKEGRKKPLRVEFQFIHGSEQGKTHKRVAYLTNLRGHGAGQSSELEFIAIDPPSFRLNAGTADGRVYNGKVSEVIRQVVHDYAPGIDVAVSETDDNSKNKFYMMRMDPKTFIGSVLEWSSAVSKDKSRWIVSSKDTKINIKKESDLEGIDLGVYSVASNKLAPRDVEDWELDLNNFITAYQMQLSTGGISAVSGRYIDSISAKKDAVVRDETTDQKRNVKGLDASRAFSKPDGSKGKDWPQGPPTTYIMSVPEQSAGDMGVEYSDYIDGRARQKFINMLSIVMKIKIQVPGHKLADNSELLGVSTCTLLWKDISQEDNLYFLHGNWIVYGFNHIYSNKSGRWITELYLCRLDHNAASKLLKSTKSPSVQA